jgi:hypothetical protein
MSVAIARRELGKLLGRRFYAQVTDLDGGGELYGNITGVESNGKMDTLRTTVGHFIKLPEHDGWFLQVGQPDFRHPTTFFSFLD